ncbi:MAG: hypothetical protein WA746_12070 [Isosphaeraceae bacterium]
MILRRSILATQAPAASLLIRLIVGAGPSNLDALGIKVTEGNDG